MAYEVYDLQNENQQIGMGMIGELSERIEEKEFLEKVKTLFGPGCIRHSTLLQKPIKKVAVLGGSGSFAIGRAKRAGADIFLPKLVLTGFGNRRVSRVGPSQKSLTFSRADCPGIP